MGTIKENPNKLQTEEAKSTRPDDLRNEKDKEYQEIQKKKEKNVSGESDEGAVNDEPYDAQSNSIHLKR